MRWDDTFQSTQDLQPGADRPPGAYQFPGDCALQAQSNLMCPEPPRFQHFNGEAARAAPEPGSPLELRISVHGNSSRCISLVRLFKCERCIIKGCVTQNTGIKIHYYAVRQLLFANSVTEELRCDKDLFNIGTQGLIFPLEMKNDQVVNLSRTKWGKYSLNCDLQSVQLLPARKQIPPKG